MLKMLKNNISIALILLLVAVVVLPLCVINCSTGYSGDKVYENKGVDNITVNKSGTIAFANGGAITGTPTISIGSVSGASGSFTALSTDGLTLTNSGVVNNLKLGDSLDAAGQNVQSVANLLFSNAGDLRTANTNGQYITYQARDTEDNALVNVGSQVGASDPYVQWGSAKFQKSGSNTFGGDNFILDGNGVVVGHTSQITTTAGYVMEAQIVGSGGDDATILVAAFKDATPLITNAPTIEFLKSEDNTLGTNGIVYNNDIVGAIRGIAADGGDFRTEVARMQFIVNDANPAVNDVGADIEFLTASGSGADDIAIAFTITSDGGTLYKLNTATPTATAGMTFYNSNVNCMFTYDGSNWKAHWTY